MVRINAVTRCFCQWLAFSGLNLTDVSFSCIAFENSALLQSTPLWSSQHESQNTPWTSCGIWARNVEQREIIFIYDGKYIKARQICYKTTRISWWGSIQDQSPFSGSPARRFVLFLTVLISVYLSVFEQFRSIPVYSSPSKNEWRISSRIRRVLWWGRFFPFFEGLSYKLSVLSYLTVPQHPIVNFGKKLESDRLKNFGSKQYSVLHRHVSTSLSS